MRQHKLIPFISGLLTAFVLLFSGSLTQLASASATMPQMMEHKTASGPCSSMCTSQTPVAATTNNPIEQDKEPNPRPAEPYYLAFIGFGWATAINIALAYLLRYLRWRPPDLVTLYANYQF